MCGKTIGYEKAPLMFKLGGMSSTGLVFLNNN
jgi:hypothetical protein